MRDLTLNVAIGQRVQELRKQAGLTLRTVEERTGILSTQLSGLERGARNWMVNHLELVADALGVQPRDLMPGNDAPAVHSETGQLSELVTLRALVAQTARDAARLTEDLRRLAGEGGG